MSGFTDRLVEAMTGRKLAVVARECRLSRSQLYELMRGDVKTAPRLETVAALAVALDVRAPWLAFGDGTKEVSHG